MQYPRALTHGIGLNSVLLCRIEQPDIGSGYHCWVASRNRPQELHLINSVAALIINSLVAGIGNGARHWWARIGVPPTCLGCHEAR